MARPEPASPARPVNANADGAAAPTRAIDASPLRAAAIRTAALVSSAVSSPARLVTGLFSEAFGVVYAAVKASLPEAVTATLRQHQSVTLPPALTAEVTTAAYPEGSVTEPRTVEAELVLEPISEHERETRRIAEAAASRYMHDHRNTPTLRVIPSALRIGDRFRLYYGRYLDYPPLWLALYGNPGQLWGE